MLKPPYVGMFVKSSATGTRYIITGVKKCFFKNNIVPCNDCIGQVVDLLTVSTKDGDIFATRKGQCLIFYSEDKYEES